MLSMMTVHKKKIAVVLCAALLMTSASFPILAQDDACIVSEQLPEQSDESSVAWYKNESNQKIATGVVLAAVVAYVVAVRMGKVASPFAVCSAVANCWAKKNNAKNNLSETDKTLNNQENKGTEPVKPQVVEKSEQENTLAAVGKQWFADATNFLIEKAKCFESRREGFDPVA
jgi:hypothetical protein